MGVNKQLWDTLQVQVAYLSDLNQSGEQCVQALFTCQECCGKANLNKSGGMGWWNWKGVGRSMGIVRD